MTAPAAPDYATPRQTRPHDGAHSGQSRKPISGSACWPLDRVLERLLKVKRSGSGWVARCPAHDDSKPSLSIGAGNDGKVLLRCHAGCSFDAIVKALGLTPADPVATRQPMNSARSISYLYRNETGEILYRVVRAPGKGFYQERPDGNTWIPSLDGVRRVLYQLPEVITANPDETVWVVEGEKDCDRLTSLGFIATTNPGGAGKWRPEFAEPLRGRHVVIVPDNDLPGAQHAEKVAKSLDGVAASVKLLSLPGLPMKGDVSDWLDHGGTAERLRELANAAPTWETSARAGIAEATPHRVELNGRTLPYEVVGGGIVWHKPTKIGPIAVRLTNFTAQICRDVVVDDGIDRRAVYDMITKLRGRTQRFDVPAAKFASLGWIDDHLGAGAVVEPGPGLRDRVGHAIKVMSGEAPREVRYTHTGWRELDGNWVYLSGGGAIDADGRRDDLVASLPSNLAGFSLPEPPTGEELATAIRASLAIAEVAPDHLILPLLGATCRAVLGEADFSVFLVGSTQVGKSELAALAQQHFGAGLDARQLPGSWSSTANALEGIGFTLKDSVLVVDDFVPGGDLATVNRRHTEADRLLRGAANRQGRSRMNADGTLRPDRHCRALVISTGETLPRGQSLAARMLILRVGPDDVRWDRLTVAQSSGQAGAYAAAMSAFLRWLAPQIGVIQAGLAAKIAELRADFVTAGASRRLPSNVAQVAIGWWYWLKFAVDCGAIDYAEAALLWDRVRAALAEIGREQSEAQTDTDPARRFVELLSNALACGRCHLADWSDWNRPPTGGTPTRWGWSSVGVESRPNGDRVGWVDGEEVYLLSGPTYSLIARLSREADDPISVGERTLTRRLHEAGLLATIDQARGKLAVRRMHNGQSVRVLHLSAATLSRD